MLQRRWQMARRGERGRLLRATLVALIGLWTLPLAAQDSTAEVSFAGETIEWIIPFSPGGGSDIWARFLAPFLERHLPGNPEVNPVNAAGGGGTRGANIFADRARPDGLMILGTSGSTQFPYLLGDLRVRYDYEDWSVLATSPTGGMVFVAPELGLTSWRDTSLLRNQRLVFASQGPTSLDLVPLLAFRLLGLDVNYVFGYSGRNDGLTAMFEGDVNIDYQTSASVLQNLMPAFDSGELVPLMTWGILEADRTTRRDPTFPDMPTVEEVYEFLYGTPPSGPDYETYRAFVNAGFAAQKMVVIPAATPAPIQQAWIEAWEAVIRDPDFLARAPEVLGIYPMVVGDEAEQLARRVMRIDPDIRRRAHQLLEREFSVRLSE